MEVKTSLKPTKNLIRTADSYSTRSMTDKEINPSPEGADLNLQRFKSRIHPIIEYEPKRNIYPEDCNIELSVYELHEFNTNFLVALGKAKYKYSERGVHYVPIYLVPSNLQEPKVQIGIYEYEKDRSVDILDMEGDIDIDKLTPIFYPFAEEVVKSVKSNVTEFLTKSMGSVLEPAPESVTENVTGLSDSDSDDDDVLNLSKTKSQISSTTSKQQDKIDKRMKKGVFTIDPNFQKPVLLPEETKEIAEEIKKNFDKSPQRRDWIKEFMRNPNYDIHQVEANGDCFFATIREAFKQIGYHTTVADLRAILANEVTDEIYQENRRLYLDLEGSIKENDKTMEKLKLGNESLKNRYKLASTHDREIIRKELKELEDQANELISTKKSTQEMISETMGNMSEINTFDKYREYIQTTQYWADSWAISTLERVLNIKIIIFSELYYNEDAPHSVLNCGEVNTEIEKQGKFHPNFYIITTYSGDHYNLVSYKSKKILTFSEIPYDVKTMIINKCIEKSAGIYYMIEDFRNFKVRLGIQPDIGAPDTESDDDEPTTEEPGEGRSRLGSIDKQELYDSSVVFRFFGKSEKTPLPGKGTGETIPTDKMMDYKDLKSIPDWRRKLDDSWVSIGKGQNASSLLTSKVAESERKPEKFDPSFTVEGHAYASVEHYYQSSKFQYTGNSPQNQDFALLFSLDSDSKISKDVILCRAAGGKSGKIKNKDKTDLILRPKEVSIDPQFYESRNKSERVIALQAKFEQIPEMKRLLMLTKRAKLVQYIAKQPPEVDIQLMEVRKRIKNGTS